MSAARVHRYVVAALVIALFASGAVWAAVHPASAATRNDCASLGQAAGFVAFSNGDFNASPPGGENITGRIAAADDLTIGGAGSGGVFVSPAPGDPSPTVIAGHDLSLGQSRAGGTLNGGARYGHTITVAPNFVVNGGQQQASPGFSFDDEFESLRTLSASLADLDQSAGATVSLNPYSRALELTGTEDGLNVFTVSASQLTQAAGITMTLTKPGATALINVTTDTNLTVAPQYENLTGVDAAHIAWNLPLATAFTISGSVDWKGLVLAPNAQVTMASNGEFHGQVIAANIPAASRTLAKVAFAGCLPQPPPVTPPDKSLTLSSLCVNAAGEATMRLRNTGDHARQGTWLDQGGTDFGIFDVPTHSDLFFIVDNPTTDSMIQATSGATTVSSPVVLTPCQGQITVRLVTIGPAPADATWDVRLDAGTGSRSVLPLQDGEQETTTVAGGYTPGAAPIDQVIGGVPYTVSVPDPLGGAATVSLNPIEILDGQHEIVTVTIAYEEPGGVEPEGPNVEEPEAPEQPTLPAGSPDPLPGPDLGSSASGTDLSITHQITPRRVEVGGTVAIVTRVRNIGSKAAVGVVTREIPQFHPAVANSVAHVLTQTTTRGHCTSRRPVRCALGTLAPGMTVTIRSRARILVAQSLRSVLIVSSETAETNTTNNTSIAPVTGFAPTPKIGVSIGPRATVHVGQRVRYRVSVTGGGKAGAASVRLCTKVPATLIAAHAPGTLKFGGQLCRTTAHLGARSTLSFTVSALAWARGHLSPSAAATASDIARPVRAVTRIHVLGPLVACASSMRAPALARTAAMTHRPPPRARAAC
ncbi:MAG TPA: collagen-binding domain-containing protein [Solirubrobacteraceae bacterium]|jgi:choice-of-anchor A domain-containing protein